MSYTAFGMAAPFEGNAAEPDALMSPMPMATSIVLRIARMLFLSVKVSAEVHPLTNIGKGLQHS